MATVNTNNYTIGGVDLYFEASVAHASLIDTTGTVTPGSNFRTTARSLGNVVTSEIGLDVTYIEHWVSVNGSRRKDKIQANTRSLTIPFTFDEMNDANLKKFFLASTIGGANKFAVLQNPLNEGAVSLLFRSDIGPDLVYSIPKAVIRPDGNLTTNTEDWWTGPMVIEVLHYSTGSWASKPYGVLDTAPAP